jgi:hypothetical protein
MVCRVLRDFGCSDVWCCDKWSRNKEGSFLASALDGKGESWHNLSIFLYIVSNDGHCDAILIYILVMMLNRA